jgi:unsaturated chondroitin disaccharide hydrolase
MYWTSRRARTRREVTVEPEIQQSARHALELAGRKVAALVSRHPDYFPLYTDGGRWKHGKEEAWTNWCEGFLGGQLWLLAEHGVAGAPAGTTWQSLAEHYTGLVEDRQHDRDVHDLGFVFAPTHKKWWELTGETRHRDVALTAGRTLSTRFDPTGRYLRSFLAPDSTFIDIMMNVGLVLWTGLETGDDALVRIARERCATTRRYLVRGDGSVSHEGIFDVRTGAFLRQTTQQGWRDDSAWARGLAWSLYGFTAVHALDPDPHWLNTARLNARFWIEHTTEDPVPPNDFDEPDPQRRWESSAAACAAGALLMLAALVEDDEEAETYRRHALGTVRRLCEPEFLAHEPQWEGVLKHASYHEAKGLGVDESVMWGDYFFVETLARVLAAPTVAR